jgi:arginase
MSPGWIDARPYDLVVSRKSELRLISWPFHNGSPEFGMGRGAARLAVDEDLRHGLSALEWRVVAEGVAPAQESDAEITRTIELVRRLSGQVSSATADGAFPLVLAGNCISCLGTVAGCGSGDGLGVVWFDAHADFDDPAENTSGFFDVMGLAMLTGRGWDALRATIPGHAPIPEAQVLLAGVRDLEPYQRRTLEASELLVVPDAIDAPAFETALRELRSRVSGVYLHVDVDVLDAREAQANEYAAPGGPDLKRLLRCIGLVGEAFTIAGAAVTAYDPAYDAADRTLCAARRVGIQIAACARQGRTRETVRQAAKSARRPGARRP